jgi:diguanylate cyclase (GGDEF)-like protein
LAYSSGPLSSIILAGGMTLKPERQNILLYFSIGTVLALIPYALLHLIEGSNLLGCAILLFAIALGTITWQLSQAIENPVSYVIVVATLTLAIVYATYVLGIGATMWSYPAITSMFFVLPRKSANYSGLLIAIPISFLAQQEFDTAFALKILASQIFTIIMMNTIIGVITDLQQQLLDQAIKDPLTGVFNRRHMDATLQEVKTRHNRTADPVSILVIDIDHFKQVNDQYGHAAGDHALKALVSVIQDNIRETDRLFRMGGEEFLLLLWATAGDTAMIVANQLRARIQDAMLIDNKQITVSIGVNSLSKNQSVEKWLAGADDALYQAKNTGRNIVCNTKQAT